MMAHYARSTDAPTLYGFPTAASRNTWVTAWPGRRVAMLSTHLDVRIAQADCARDPSSLAILFPDFAWAGNMMPDPPDWAMIVHDFECCGAREVWPLRSVGVGHLPKICAACDTEANPEGERARLLGELVTVLREFPNDDWEDAPEQGFVDLYEEHGGNSCVVSSALYQRFLDAFNAYQRWENQARTAEILGKSFRGERS